ncbi:pectate lyase family protein [Flagellimonas allohymeniacidonis]|uniref:Pectate lyase domain-containing protein n=1 Tax=Flagellimonas allohymeniacidonis TaxID=2517819 RepID=A0A4Q8QK24_9FLAO|nr:hypothetical protein [Allomuricauda hymeniacidonis]TAI48586.1 hypothetical protein EW142_01930 [Allomuricauda hymeniacidonis]
MCLKSISSIRLHFLLILFTLSIVSCTKDNDLFTEAIEDSIEKENQETGESGDEVSDDDTSNGDPNINEDDKASELKAFPTAFGAGAFTSGGRGGQVIHVTNLNDSGEGSLRAALRTTGPRIIVFDVSGVITLNSRIIMDGRDYGNVTVAGQTAPRGGITIRGGRIWWANSENIIVRYLKFRNGNQSDNGDCMTIARSSTVIVDHCSFSYSKDEALDVSGDANPPSDDITLQNNLFGECKTAMIVGSNTAEGYGSVSVLRNATANVGWRFPKAGGAVELDVINNVHHNWRFRTIRMDGFDYTLNQINNYYQSGSNTTGGSLHKTWTNTNMSPRIYSSGNHISENIKPAGYDSNSSMAWEEFSSSVIEPRPEWFVGSELPIQGAPAPIMTASEALNYVIGNTGSYHYINNEGGVSVYRDSLDEGYLELISSDSGQVVMKEAAYGQMPTSMPSESRPGNYDTDRDGMADPWEVFIFGDLSKTANGDEDGDGYTNIEEFLNQVDSE